MIKKLISGLIAALLAVGVTSSVVFAADDSVFSFDNSNGLTAWSTEGDKAVKDTGFAFSISDSEQYDGAGSLAFSENMTKEAENIGGGAFFSSSSVGIDSLAGCTITAMVYPVAGAADLGAKITMYSDGEVYIPVTSSALKSNSWNMIQLKVPSNCNNTKIGFNIPLNRIYNGVVFYLDDVKIQKADGAYLPNIGDYEEPSEDLFSNLSPTHTIILIAGFVVLAVAIIIGIIVFINKTRKKYR
jgi:hypothetical protein